MTITCGHGVYLNVDCELCKRHLRADLKSDCRIMADLRIVRVHYKDVDSVVTEYIYP